MGGVVSKPFNVLLPVFGGGGSSSPSAPAPTTAEVSQSSATDATQTISKRRRGKSPSILTDALGNAGTAPTESKTLLGS